MKKRSKLVLSTQQTGETHHVKPRHTDMKTVMQTIHVHWFHAGGSRARSVPSDFRAVEREQGDIKQDGSEHEAT